MGGYVSGVAHQDDLALVEHPLFVRQAIVQGPTAGLVLHQGNQLLDHGLPAFVHFEDL
jgi:hypothetical protein